MLLCMVLKSEHYFGVLYGIEFAVLSPEYCWLVGKVIAALLDERLMRKINMLTVFLQEEFINQIILTASY